jgi:NADH:ubiquinone oxidoreductase subunit C
MQPNSSPPLHDELTARFGDAVLAAESLGGREALVLRPSALLEAVRHLRGALGFDVLIDLCGADYSGYPGHQGDPLCVSYQLFSTATRRRAWLKVYLPLEGARVDSLCGEYGCANWYERETFDMYGVDFAGHPNLKRLLLYEEFKGHPLRKDYPIQKMQPLIPMRNAVDYEAVARARRSQSPDEAGGR